MIDETDRKILNILQEDSRTSNAAVGRMVGLSAAAIHARVKKLVRAGVIRRFTLQVDCEAVGLGILAFVRVFLAEMRRADETLEALAGMDEIVECHHTIGDACFLLKVRCPSPERLEDLLERINQAPGVGSTHTTLALRTSRERTAPPLAAAPEHAPETTPETIPDPGT